MMKKSSHLKDLRQVAQEHARALKKIKVCAFDVDGILSTGLVHWEGQEVGWNRSSHIHDGYGLKMLMGYGLKVGVITAGDSLSVTRRYESYLKLDFVYKGDEDKRGAFQKILDQGHEAFEVLYMGDEIFDIPLLQRAGFSATCPEAVLEVREVVDYITSKSAGMGCVREVIDMLRYAQGLPLPHFEKEKEK